MSFTLNSGTVSQLEALLSAGNYPGAYQLIIDSISDSDGKPLPGVDHSVWLWFYGALSINRDVGPFSDFIRSYTEDQFEIRIGQSFSPMLLQEASDGIAQAVIDGIIDSNGELPTINQIGTDDASEVAAQILNDAALWSGNLLFVGLGDRTFFDNAILDDPANTYDLLTLVESMSSAFGANTPSEWQNALEDLAEDSIVDAAGVPILTAISTAASVVSGRAGLIASVISDANDFVEDAYAGRLGVFSTALLNRVLGTNSAGDNLQGSDQIDIYHGGQNNDTLIGSLGIDLLDGGSGQDVADYSMLGQPLLVALDNKSSNVPFAAEIKSTGAQGSVDWAFDIEELILGNQPDQVIALAGSTSTLTHINTAGGDDVINLSQYDEEIIIDAGAGSDEVTLGNGGGRAFGGAGVDTLAGGAGDDLMGNIHAPTFDYAALTPAEIQAIVDSEDAGPVPGGEGNGARTTLDGGAGDDVYLVDYSSDFSSSLTHGASHFRIKDDDAGTKLFVRDMATGDIDAIAGELIRIPWIRPSYSIELVGDNGITATATIPSLTITFYGFLGSASGALYIVGHDTPGDYSATIVGDEAEVTFETIEAETFNPDTARSLIRFDSIGAFYAAGRFNPPADEVGVELDFAPDVSGNADSSLRISLSDISISDLAVGMAADLGLDELPQSDPQPSLSAGVMQETNGDGSVTTTGTGGDDFAFTAAGAQIVDLQDGHDVAVTGGDNDSIDLGDGDDAVVAGGGDDMLNGGAGADTLDGGAGDDALMGGTGGDRYLFQSGFGADRIIESANTAETDRIVFGNTIDASEIIVAVDNLNSNHLFIRHAASDSSIVVENFFLNDGSGVEEIEFSDGTVWDRATIEAMLAPPITTAPDAQDVPENAAYAVDVLANDVTQDGGSLTLTQASIVSGLGSVSLLGDLVLYDSGADNYNELQAGENATVEISYTAADAFGNTAADTLTVTVRGRNDAPAVVNDMAATDNATAVVIDPLANDSDVDGGTLSLTTGFDFSGNEVKAFIFDGEGSVAANGDLLTYDPAGAYDDLAPGETALVQMLYFVADGQGGTNVGLIQVDVEGAAGGGALTAMTAHAVEGLPALEGRDALSGRGLYFNREHHDDFSGRKTALKSRLLRTADGTATLHAATPLSHKDVSQANIAVNAIYKDATHMQRLYDNMLHHLEREAGFADANDEHSLGFERNNQILASATATRRAGHIEKTFISLLQAMATFDRSDSGELSSAHDKNAENFPYGTALFGASQRIVEHGLQ